MTPTNCLFLTYTSFIRCPNKLHTHVTLTNGVRLTVYIVVYINGKHTDRHTDTTSVNSK